MLRYALINCDYIETIHLKFLLPGHTYMPVDSIHATIEHFVRKRIVWAPSEWATVVRSSRTNPEPYTVVPMSNANFLHWAQIQRVILPASCRSENDNQHIQWKKVRAVTMNKASPKFDVRYSMVEGSENHTFCFPRHGYIPPPNRHITSHCRFLMQNTTIYSICVQLVLSHPNFTKSFRLSIQTLPLLTACQKQMMRMMWLRINCRQCAVGWN